MLQKIGFYLRIGGPSLIAVAALVKAVLSGPDAFNVAVFLGLLAAGAGQVIAKYFPARP